MEEQDRQFKESVTDVEATSLIYREFALICQLEARERGMNDAKVAAAIAGTPSSPRAIKKPFKVPHFFKRGPLGNKRFQLLCSPEMVDKLESGGSVSSCKVFEIVKAIM